MKRVLLAATGLTVMLLLVSAGLPGARLYASGDGPAGRLAFVSGESVALLDLQTGALRRLFTAPAGEGVGPPHWSPDRTVIAFEGPDGNAWLVNVDGSNARPLTTQAVSPVGCDEGGCAEPGTRIDSLRWSPDGSRLSYRLVERLATASLWVVSHDGTGAQQLASAADLCLFNEGWTPDGVPLVSRCVFAAGSSNASYLVRSGELKPFVAGSQISYASDGGRMAFSNHSVTADGVSVTLFSGRSDGSAAEAVAAGGQDPLWSPAGLLAYQVGTPDGWRIHVLDPATHHDVDLGVGELGAWSGDGRWLFYSVVDGSGSTVWRVRPDGSGAAPVTDGRFPAAAPAAG